MIEQTEQSVLRYDVVDIHTRVVVRTYLVLNAGQQGKQRRAAHRHADALDRKYGAVRYIVVPTWLDKGETAMSQFTS